MSQPAQSEHRDDIARTRAGISQRVESRDPRAQQRRRVNGRQVIWKSRHRVGGGNHAFAVTAVEADASDLLRLAREQVSAPAGVAPSAVSAVPSDTDTLAGRPADDPFANSI